jgi:hypothetical protein
MQPGFVSRLSYSVLISTAPFIQHEMNIALWNPVGIPAEHGGCNQALFPGYLTAPWFQQLHSFSTKWILRCGIRSEFRPNMVDVSRLCFQAILRRLDFNSSTHSARKWILRWGITWQMPRMLAFMFDIMNMLGNSCSIVYLWEVVIITQIFTIWSKD